MRPRRYLSVICAGGILLSLTSCSYIFPTDPASPALAKTLDENGNIQIYVPACGDSIEVKSIEIYTKPGGEDTFWSGEAYQSEVDSSGGVSITLLESSLWESVNDQGLYNQDSIKDASFRVRVLGSKNWTYGFSSETTKDLQEGSYVYMNEADLSREEVEEACIDRTT